MIFLFFNVRRKLNSLQLNVLYGRLFLQATDVLRLFALIILEKL